MIQLVKASLSLLALLCLILAYGLTIVTLDNLLPIEGNWLWVALLRPSLQPASGICSDKNDPPASPYAHRIATTSDCGDEHGWSYELRRASCSSISANSLVCPR